MALVGTELNAEMELQTAVDTIRRRPKPVGARGAVVADTVGEARLDARVVEKPCAKARLR